jgi:Protein of unknown function (DUF3551)
MRHILPRMIALIGAISAIHVASAMPSKAEQINPWCLKAVMGRGSTPELCYFRTFARCNQERFLYGPTSFCLVNPEYYFRYGEPVELQPRKRRTVLN